VFIKSNAEILVHAIWLYKMEAEMRDILSRQFQHELIAMYQNFSIGFYKQNPYSLVVQFSKINSTAV
jgi:hypothetical protein